MAKLVLRKYPKKPKASASAATIQNYFDRCREIDKENSARRAEHNKALALQKKLRTFRPGKSSIGGGTRKRRAAAPKRKSAKRKK